jgi:hypothetical protein
VYDKFQQQSLAGAVKLEMLGSQAEPVGVKSEGKISIKDDVLDDEDPLLPILARYIRRPLHDYFDLLPEGQALPL